MANGCKALEVIKSVGIWGLSEGDGCLCCHFEIQGIGVDVHCRKSSGAVPSDYWGIVLRVHSGHMDIAGSDLDRVAQEVARQLRECESSTPLMIRYCDWGHDSKRECTYCGKPRDNFESYLCSKCQSSDDVWGEKIAANHDYSTLPKEYPVAEEIDS